MSEKTTILLVDDHPVFRKGLRLLLEEEEDIHVIGEAGNGQEAVRLARELSPAVVVMDITMPGLDGIEATRHLCSESSEMKVIVLSIHSGKRFVENMLRAGALGYVLKESAPEELVKGIRTVMKGGVYLSPEIAGVVVSDYVDALEQVEAAAGDVELTIEEKTLLRLLVEGNSTKQIAAAFRISVKGAETRGRELMLKLGVGNVGELTELVRGHGLLAESRDSVTAASSAPSPKAQSLIENLTNRELEVLGLLGERLYDKEIADRLSVSPETVKTHLRHIYEKLAVRNRRQAVRKGKFLGLLEDG